MPRKGQGGYTLTPVVLKVSVDGFKDIIAHSVQIRHTVNDFSYCDVSVIARSDSEVVAFKQIFPNLKNAKDFTKMTVSVQMKAGPKNTIKEFSQLWKGTLVGLSPSFSPGSIEFTLHGIGGLFFSSTMSLYSPGLHSDGGAIGTFDPERLAMDFNEQCETLKDLKSLFEITVKTVKEAFQQPNTMFKNARGQMKGIKFDLLDDDLKKVRVVPGMGYTPVLATETSWGKAFIDNYFQDMLKQGPQETFWSAFLSTAIFEGAALVSIGDQVLLTPTYFVSKPLNADKPYDPLKPPTNIIYAEDLLSTSPGIRAFDAPTRIGAFVGGDAPSEGTFIHANFYSGDEIGMFRTFPNDPDDFLQTLTQQEEKTGARILNIKLPHWLSSRLSMADLNREEHENSDCQTQKMSARQDEIAKVDKKLKQELPKMQEDQVKKYLKHMYYRIVLASRAGAATCRLRLDCVPGLPCQIKAPWEAFDVEAYVVSVTHTISTTPESASTVLQFTHSRFKSEEVDAEDPMYPGVTVAKALPAFEAAARGKKAGEAGGGQTLPQDDGTPASGEGDLGSGIESNSAGGDTSNGGSTTT